MSKIIDIRSFVKFLMGITYEDFYCIFDTRLNNFVISFNILFIQFKINKSRRKEFPGCVCYSFGFTDNVMLRLDKKSTFMLVLE